MSETWPAATGELHTYEREPCLCLPPSPTCAGRERTRESAGVPVAPALARILQEALVVHFPRATPLSLLLLHIAQFERLPLPSTSPVVPQRLCYHAPVSLLEQIVQVMRRSLRANDQILPDEHGSGAALLFPEVDLEGISRIAGRVSASIHLLQAETVTPPLRYETEIVLGTSVCSQPAASPDALLIHAGQIWETISFRPAVLSPANHLPSTSRERVPRPGALTGGIPFIQIPSRLPTRLQRLIPHTLALQLRCAPVGRDHNRLTVAMANPTDMGAISHLREVTGLAIFPVACELSALEALLASGW